jgi:hypothetical protein
MIHPVWGPKAMALTIANQILSTTYRQCGKMTLCEQTLLGTINVLRSGDSTCCIRAMGLCLTLCSWRREWGDIAGSSEAESLLIQIQSQLRELDVCSECRSHLKCKGWSLKRADCLGCQSTKRKMCRTCKGAGQRRRRTIKARKELISSSKLNTSDVEISFSL